MFFDFILPKSDNQLRVCVTVQLHTLLPLCSVTSTSSVQLPSPVQSPASDHSHLVSLIPFTWSSCPSHLLPITSLVPHLLLSSAGFFCVFPDQALQRSTLCLYISACSVPDNTLSKGSLFSVLSPESCY